jgi:putative nucleotidyltransferase with HDIG domain
MALSLEKLVLEFKSDSREAHCRRVAAWSSELARVAGSQSFPFLSQPLIAALDGPKRAEFLKDLGVEIAFPERDIPRADRNILELAKALEDHFAWEPFEEGDPEPSPFAEAAFDLFRCVSRSQLDRAIANLPVFPVAAQRAMQLLVNDGWKAADLEIIAASDQVLAAELVGVANSCAFGACRQVTTLGHAIAFIGAERASSILIAASVKRLFAAKRLHEIWNHSLEASEIARSLAKLTGRVRPEEALLAGLVHDIGRLAMALLPEDFQRRASNLLNQGCELPLVERVLCGLTHAELGAKALERWRFPPAFVEAVMFHHRPERSASPMASILYLAERCTNPEEDLPSPARSKTAMDRLNLDSENSYRFDLSSCILNSLRF